MEREVKHIVENERLAALTDFIQISKNVCENKNPNNDSFLGR